MHWGCCVKELRSFRAPMRKADPPGIARTQAFVLLFVPVLGVGACFVQACGNWGTSKLRVLGDTFELPFDIRTVVL